MKNELTSRELQVLGLVAEGKSTKEISQELGITEGTVNTHRDHVNQKLGKLKLKGIGEITRYALEKGLALPMSFNGKGFTSYGFTERQQQVLILLGEGESSKEVATKLSMSVRTVESHRINILEKIGFSASTISTAALFVHFALQYDLLPSEEVIP